MRGSGKASVALSSTTLDDDRQADVLSGNAGNDLFFSNSGGASGGPTDKVKDKASGESRFDVDSTVPSAPARAARV